jgi:hypothetical protein
MKFKRTWANELQKLPDDLQTHCFNYKHWKQIAKQQNVNPDDILCQIEKQSKQINRIFTLPNMITILEKHNNCTCTHTHILLFD